MPDSSGTRRCLSISMAAWKEQGQKVLTLLALQPLQRNMHHLSCQALSQVANTCGCESITWLIHIYSLLTLRWSVLRNRHIVEACSVCTKLLTLPYNFFPLVQKLVTCNRSDSFTAIASNFSSKLPLPFCFILSFGSAQFHISVCCDFSL